MVDARLKRRGQRFYYKTLDEARVKAEALATERAQNGAEALNFSTELRVMTAAAAAKLRPFGKNIEQAVDHYVEFLQSESAKYNSLSVEECVDRYLAARRRDHERGELSKRSLREIIGRANQLRAAFVGLQVRELDSKRMRDFLDSYPVTARTRTNVRARCSHLFNWCRDQGYVESNPVERIRFRVPEAEIKILPVNQTQQLLAAALASKFNATVTPYILLQLFEGLRPGEAEQLSWEQIDFAANAIHVRGPTSKSRRERWVELNETFVQWITPYRCESGLIIGANFRRQFESVRRAAGYDSKINPWVPDVLRHSFGSYWLAEHHDAAKLAHLMGNSEAVIFAHYRKSIARNSADRFWNLRA
jgi:integrase